VENLAKSVEKRLLVWIDCKFVQKTVSGKPPYMGAFFSVRLYLLCEENCG
jgi:hypothetical protein